MTDSGAQESGIEPIEVIKSFYPLILLRKIYLSVSLFSSKGLLDLAASGAFYFFLSIIPMALLVVYVLDVSLAGYGKLSDYFFNLLTQFNPQISKDFFEQIGLLNSDGKSFFGIIGIVGLIWSSRSIFSGIRSAFELIFSNGSKRSFLTDSLISLIFVPLVFVACITFFAAGIVVRRLADVFEKFGVPCFAGSSALDTYTNIITVVMIFVITFCLYRFLPSRRPSSTDAVSGAVLFTVSAVIVQKGLYGVISIASYYLVYGVISTLIVGLFWVYVLFALFYLFAQFVYVQHMFPELEFDVYYTVVSKGKGDFIENMLFRRPDAAVSRFSRSVRTGEIIFGQGDPAEAFYILSSGEVKTVRKNDNGPDAVANIFPGETFGESGVLSKTVYDRTAEAVKDSVFLEIPRSFYERAAALDPRLPQTVLDSYLAHMDVNKKTQE